jgi:hypothetical protein
MLSSTDAADTATLLVGLSSTELRSEATIDVPDLPLEATR